MGSPTYLQGDIRDDVWGDSEASYGATYAASCETTYGASCEASYDGATYGANLPVQSTRQPMGCISVATYVANPT